jgi:sulfide:quinone oxidoreductase
MKQLVILGAGTAGTIMANHLRRKLNLAEWQLTVVDQDPRHYYQPGFLFMPFGIYSEKDVVRPKRRFIPQDVRCLEAEIDQIDPEQNTVALKTGQRLSYDLLIIATGSRTVPEQTEGMVNGGWRKRVHEFYTFEGAGALSETLKDWKGGRLVVHISEMPIKCPVAPLEFCFLADWWLTERGLRDKTEIVYVTPLSGAFTKPIASQALSHLLERKRIQVVNDFAIARVDDERRKIVSWDDKEVDYDLLVTVPVNMGDAMVERSGLGDELNYVATDRHTLQAKGHPNIFVIGDATDAPTSKAGSVAHFEAEILAANILHYVKGEELRARFDGHANCFIESGFKKGFLLDFNYTLEPVPGTFPIPGIGPMRLLGESWLNHLGKMAFKWVYWHVLLKGLPIPLVSHRMTLAGKRVPADALNPQPAA